MRWSSALGASAAERRVEQQVPDALRDRAPTRLAAQLGADGARQQTGLGGLAGAFAAFDRDKAPSCTHGSNDRASGRIAERGRPARAAVAARTAAQALAGLRPLSELTISVMASSWRARCFWISTASCKTASASL